MGVVQTIVQTGDRHHGESPALDEKSAAVSDSIDVGAQSPSQTVPGAW